MKSADTADVLRRRAEDDLEIARRSLSGRSKIVWGACFHAQQAAEKSLKSFLVFRGAVPKRSHDLLDLLNQCVQIESTFVMLEPLAVHLNPLSVHVRYSDEMELTLKDAKQALKAAEQLMAFVDRFEREASHDDA